MRRFFCVFICVISPAICLADEPKPLAADASVDQVLDALKARGDSLQDLSADVDLTDVNQATADSTSHSGKLLLQNLPNGDGRVRITFTQRTEGTRIYPEQHEYTLAGGTLVERDYVKKAEVDRVVARTGEKVNLLKLGQGPFPLPIGQDPAEVHRQFDVSKVAAAKDDPADSVHVQLKPKPNAELAAHFSMIDVWVDRQSDMPVRIVSASTDGETVQTTDLSHVKLNQSLKDADFALPDVTGWDVRQEPFRQ
jgi:outer membrane lipoprotein-sorting protein